MVTLLNLAGVMFCAFGGLLWLFGRLDSGLLAWVAGAIFIIGAGIIDELQKRIPKPPPPPPRMLGPGDKPPAPRRP